jgi:cytochrome c
MLWPRTLLRVSLTSTCLLAAQACGSDDSKAPPSEPAPLPPRVVSVLVFSATEGFRHQSIEDAHRVLGSLPEEAHMTVTLTEDAGVFTDDGLAGFDVVSFVNTTGDVLDEAQQSAFQRFVRGGGGFVGVHSAADTEHEWPWYGKLVGAYFKSHPLLPLEVTVTTEDERHPSSAHLEPTFSFTDEWYNFDRNPRFDHHILLTVDEAGFTMVNTDGGESMGADHPVAWHKEFDGGRSFYTTLGHRPESWDDPLFVTHVLEGIRWASEPVSYSRRVVAPAKNPLKLAVIPDGRILFIERTGELQVWNPNTGRTTNAAVLDVDTAWEGGLLGVAVDPAFADNGHLYLYFSENGTKDNVLARFQLNADSLDLGSRHDLLRIGVERECCHEAGDVEFLPDGTLLVSTGDNTNPHESGGYAPIDKSEGRELHNAERTAGNPFELRGKILRINTDGSIPQGNLFPGGVEGAPEIYITGTRNPFTMAVDAATGRLFWGEVGPDAPVDAEQGPRGYDEINLAEAPGNYGWPYCIADNKPYKEYDFVTKIIGESFDCTGMVPSILHYDYLTVDYLALGNALVSEGTQVAAGIAFAGRNAIAGVFYRQVAGAPFSQEGRFLDTLFMADWTRDLVASVELKEDGSVRRVSRVVPFERFRRPIDMAVGTDGALYVLEYGSSFYGDNDDAGLSRIEYSETGGLSPVAVISASETAGVPPLKVAFSGEGSRILGGRDELAGYEWDVDADGTVDSTDPNFEFTFDKPGAYDATLVVIGASGRRGIPSAQQIIVGNTRPVVTIDSPANLTVVPDGMEVQLVGHATDAEDGDAACEDLVWDIRTGHNSHAHPATSIEGCDAHFSADLGSHADASGRVFYAIELSYKDKGASGGVPSLTGRAQIEIEVER